jgi:hypothetical protein
MLRIDWCSFVVSFPLVEKKEIETSMARIFNYFIVYNSNLFNSGLAFLWITQKKLVITVKYSEFVMHIT